MGIKYGYCKNMGKNFENMNIKFYWNYKKKNEAHQKSFKFGPNCCRFFFSEFMVANYEIKFLNNFILAQLTDASKKWISVFYHALSTILKNSNF